MPKWLVVLRKKIWPYIIRIIGIFLGIGSILQVLDVLGRVWVKNISIWLYISICINTWLITEILVYSLPRKRSVPAALLNQLEHYLSLGKYEIVLRYRDSISRALWVEGKPSERIRLGKLIEEAALQAGKKTFQAAALIDDLGWTSVSIKEYDVATKYINHGLRIAKEIPDYYWAAKSNRHLSGIDIERGEYNLALEKLEIAEELALKIEDEKLKIEMEAGIFYGISIAYLELNEFERSLNFLEKSEEYRIKGGDNSRVVKVFYLRGKIYQRMNEWDLAKDNYRKGLHEAETVGRTDEMIKNHLGLSNVYFHQGCIKDAENHRNLAIEMQKNTPVPLI